MRDSQVSTDRIDIASIPARSIWSMASSSISAPRQDDFAFQRIEDIDGRRAAEDTVGESSYDLAAVDSGARHQPASSAAILLSDDRILRNIDQAAGQVPEFAVLSAVSARPLRAPWVELKYSSTVSPSLKFEMIAFR